MITLSSTDTHSASSATLRKTALNARRLLSADARDAASLMIAQRVIHSREFTAAKTIACYLPMRDEVDPSRIIDRAWRANKRVFSPVVDRHGNMVFRQLQPDTTLERNHYGLWEPTSGTSIAIRTLDVVITPLVAFDHELNRIGMGGGYFDRCFAFLRHRQFWLKPKLVGLAFDCQKVDKIVPNPWDIRLYGIFSEA